MREAGFQAEQSEAFTACLQRVLQSDGGSVRSLSYSRSAHAVVSPRVLTPKELK